MSSLFTVFLICCLLSVFDDANCSNKDYCAANLCPSAKNTACHAHGRFSSKCEPDIGIVRFSQEEKDFIVQVHNFHRSQVVTGNVYSYLSGQVEYFPSATRMMKLIWDEELAILASLQLKTCESHDKCHNTYFNETSMRPTLGGQNIAFMYTTGDRGTIIGDLQGGIQSWMDESRVTPLDVVGSVHIISNYTTGHFIQMIHDRNSRIGCAMVRWTQEEGEMKCTRFTCNYFKSPYLNQPLYENGTLCSKCDDCDREDFVGLCNK